MATMEELQAALIKADAAGDTQSAKALADYIRSLNAENVLPPSQQPSTLDNVLSGGKNLGLGLFKGAMTSVDGGAELLSRGLSSAAHYIAPDSGVDKFFANNLNNVQNVNNERENQYNALTKGSIAAPIGNLLGQIAMPLKGFQAAKGANLAIRLASGATTGAVIGALQPLYNSQDYAGDKLKQIGIGTAIGGGLTGLGATIGGAYNALSPLVSPKSAAGNIILNGLEKAQTAPIGTVAHPDIAALVGQNEPNAVIARIQAAKQLVPNSKPTTAQVAGVPELLQTERNLRNNQAYRPAFEYHDLANNNARLNVVRGIAKTPEELAAAIKTREEQAQPLYDAANAAVMPVNDEFQAIMTRPSAQKAIARGQKLAAERGESIAPIAPQSVPETSSALLDANGQPFSAASKGGSSSPTQINGKFLQYLKMGLDDLQYEGKQNGMGAHEAKALSDTKNQLNNWIETNSPQYAAANKMYAEASVPVNTMQTAHDLYDTLATKGHNVTGEVNPTLSTYSSKLAQALKNAKYGIDPEAQKSLEAIQEDLQRESISNSMKFGGSDTYFNSQAPNWLSGQLFGQNLDGKSLVGRGLGAMGGYLAGEVLGGGAAASSAASAGGLAAAQKIGEFAGNRVNGQLQKAIIDPDYFSQLLSDALKRRAYDPTIMDALAPAGARAATIGAEGLVAPSSN